MSAAFRAIEVVGLEKRYGGTHAVYGLDLIVEVGEVFGLLGPNGAGKTTTVEILEGYRKPDAGSVRVLGLDPIADARRLRPQIGVMLQDGGLTQGIRPLEALKLYAAFYDDPDDPERLLDLVGLGSVQRTMTRRLSGGQRQRLSLALALVGRPALLFLDEPTAGMDPHARASTWSLIRELRTAGTTVLLTTHAMDEAEQLCDRIAIIDHGRLRASGTPAELMRHAATNVTTFSTDPGLPAVELAVAIGLAPDAISEPRAGHYLIQAEATPELVADLAGWLRDHNIRIGELRSGRRTLEDVFLSVTGASASGPES